MNTAFAFPGQGSQFVGMGKALFERHEAAREVFRAADDALGFRVSKLCFEGPEAELQLTANAQPAILATSIATLRVLEATAGIRPDLVLGHLGEYSALVCTGVLAFSDAVRIVRRRGEFMQAATPAGRGAMAAIRGPANVADELCRETRRPGEVLEVANYNSATQTVLAGDAGAVDRAIERAGARGIVATRLRVSAPFHCSLMGPARDNLATVLADARFTNATSPVVNNVDAKVRTDGDELRRCLVDQVVMSVQWAACVNTLESRGIKNVVEIGPGKVLSRLVRQIAPALATHTVETAEDIETLAKLWPKETRLAERATAASGLISFEAVVARLGAQPTELRRWMTFHGMPVWLVDGEVKFEPKELDTWLARNGTVARARA